MRQATTLAVWPAAPPHRQGQGQARTHDGEKSEGAAAFLRLPQPGQGDDRHADQKQAEHSNPRIPPEGNGRRAETHAQELNTAPPKDCWTQLLGPVRVLVMFKAVE